MGSAVCGACHGDAFARWQGSHHDLAMQTASESSVLGDFGGASFTHADEGWRFLRSDDGGFVIEATAADGATERHRVAFTFGVEPLQQLLIAFPGGRYQSFPVAWDSVRSAWFHLYPDDAFAPDDPLHWTGLYQRWNTMCADCHSTGLERGYDVETGTYATTWRELDVGCEACHGPGASHVAWARAGADPNDEKSASGLPFTGGSARDEVEVCAPCHARRHLLTSTPIAGEPLLDHVVPASLDEGLYFPDGQIDGEVYVYGSFVQSAMYAAGVRCSDCHEPHALGLRAEGNALCVRCHSETPDPRFPSLAPGRYDTPEHHHHPAGSEGAECVSCHMPERVYMQVDPRRDHGLRVPRPDLSVELGTPNACTGCHAERSDAWAAAVVAGWPGATRPGRPHFASALHAGRAGLAESTAALDALAVDPDTPAIVRATALDLLLRQGPAAVRALVAAVNDSDPWVRHVAARGLERLPPEPRLTLGGPLLMDPIRAVRIEAARVLAGIPPDSLEPDERRALDAGLREFRHAQLAQADMPSAHLNLGVVHAAQGRRARAERAYRTALGLDPGFLPARANLAHLYNQMGRNDQSERVLREGIARTPAEGELHYSLGLLLAEQGRLAEAAAALGDASARLPGRPRVRLNRGLALQQLGQLEEAEAALGEAFALAPEDASIVHALAVFFAQQERWSEALPHAQKLVALLPGGEEPAKLLAGIEAALAVP
jgi:predicted CXXCH cytochrome family protein